MAFSRALRKWTLIIRIPMFSRRSRFPSIASDLSIFSSLLLISMIQRKQKTHLVKAWKTSKVSHHSRNRAGRTGQSAEQISIGRERRLDSSSGAYKLRLKGKALPEFKSLCYDDNNLLAASWTFRQYMVGTETNICWCLVLPRFDRCVAVVDFHPHITGFHVPRPSVSYIAS